MLFKCSSCGSLFGKLIDFGNKTKEEWHRDNTVMGEHFPRGECFLCFKKRCENEKSSIL